MAFDELDRIMESNNCGTGQVELNKEGENITRSGNVPRRGCRYDRTGTQRKPITLYSINTVILVGLAPQESTFEMGTKCPGCQRHFRCDALELIPFFKERKK